MIFWSIAILIVACFLFFFLFGYLCFRNACHRRRAYPADRRAHGGGTPLPPQGQTALDASRFWFDSQDFASVSIVSSDGLTLSGQTLSAGENAKGIVICFHGYHSSCRRDFSLQTMMLHRAGYHLLLATQRSHGESEGTYICFGAKERLDVAPWCRFALQHFGDLPITLFGLSMGASTVLMAASTDLPPQVKRIVGDCGFSDPFAIIKNTLRHKHHLLPVPLIDFMNYWSRVLAGFDFRQISCEEALKDSSLPVLLLHGEEDAYVPTKMSRDLAKALPNQVSLVLFPHARHGQSVYYDPQRYEQEVLSFLEREK